jgi:3-deoxy-D-manno-octulosonic-acid transferase
MTGTLKAVEVNCETGQTTERELTAEEIEQRELDAIAAATRREEEEAAAAALAALKASAKAKLVAGTPLTEEEAATLVI